MLTKIKFAPGIDKQDTSVGAEGRWVDSDNVRFRYGLPEKVGGWSSLITDTIVGVARRQFAFVDIAGNRYVAIGTDKFLLLYFEGQLYDITPVKAALSSATIATTNGTTGFTYTTSLADESSTAGTLGDTGTFASLFVDNGYRLTYHSRYTEASAITDDLQSGLGLDTAMHHVLVYYVKFRLLQDMGDVQQAEYYRNLFNETFKKFPSRKSGVRFLAVPRM